jgi:DNA gyrase/topoisomerase IV subunit A
LVAVMERTRRVLSPDEGRQTTDDNLWSVDGSRQSAVVGPFISALRAADDDRLLLVTSRYRFLLTTARQLADLRGIGQNIENLYRFAAREAVCAIVNWTAARAMERLLLVTSTGYARAYPLDALAPAIEAPTPLTFDNPLPGVPVLAQGVVRGQDVVIATEGGRAVRWPLAKIPLTGVQAINPGRDESFDRVSAALAVEPEGEVVLVLTDGYARRLRVAWVEEAPKANVKGKVLVARRAAAVALAQVGAIEVVTDRRVLTADGGALPLEEGTKALRFVSLEAGESVTTVVSD